MGSWLSEIKRRNVFKVGTAYLVLAWVLIQVADVIAPQLNLPEWAPRLITLLVLLGFPIALVLAWTLDLTPQGIKVEDHSAGDKGFYLVAAVLVMAVVAWYVWDRSQQAQGASDKRSIAVLPFVNMSGDPQNDYFSDGISEEVLDRLAHLPALHVAARTSSFAFKGEKVDIQKIAAELKVQLVLEGSVRRQGEQVRITAQLIDAANGFHLWSDTYDRNLTDVFAIQDEIAAKVAQALQLQLGSARPVVSSTRLTHPETIEKYLRAKALFNHRQEKQLREAADLYQQVVSADPQIAEGYAGLALVYAVMPFYTSLPRTDLHELARNAAEHALALDPGLADAYGALGDVAIHARRFDDAEALLRRAIAAGPSFAAGHYWLAEKDLFTGELDAAMDELDQARAIEPQSRAGDFLRANTLLAMGKPEEAGAVCGRVLKVAPEIEQCRALALLVALGSGDTALARRILVDNPNVHGDTGRQMAQGIADALDGQGDIRVLAEQLMAMPYHAIFDPSQSGYVHEEVLPALLLALGQTEMAIQRLLLNAREEPSDVLNVLLDPQLDRLRCDPRVRQMVQSLNVTDRRAKTVCAGRPDA